MSRSCIIPGDEGFRVPRRRLLIPAAVLLLVLAPCGHREASAGSTTYSWRPVVGSGTFTTFPDYQTTHFTTDNGGISITYDPDDPGYSHISFSTGSPGYGVYAYMGFGDVVSDGYVTFRAYGIQGVTAVVSVVGDPGPLDSSGDPLSLESLVGAPAYVNISPGYHADQLSFYGEAVPEPSSLPTLTLGVGGTSLAYAVRRMKKRPGPRGLAGRS